MWSLSPDANTVPLQVCLVVRRHMILHRAILVGTTLKAQMGGDTGARKEDFYCGLSKAHIHLLLDY